MQESRPATNHLFSHISVFYLFLKNLDLPIETIIRFPSALFGALNVSLVYLIAGKLYDKRTALLSAIVFLTTPLVLFSSLVVMMEAVSLFLILGIMYFYINEKFTAGALFLGLLVLTKWLYAISPILFIVLFFFKNKNLPKILLSFLIVPAALATYLVLSYISGTFDNVILGYSFDLTRPMPAFELYNNLFLISCLLVTFPLSVFFLYLLASKNLDIWKEKHLIAVALLNFLLPFSSLYLWWYSIIAIPALVIIVVKKMPDLGLPFMITIFVSLNIFAFILVIIPFTETDADLKEAMEISKGKNVTFYETRGLSAHWHSWNERYMFSDKSYLLLEQNNPGIMFYRFNDNNDYHNFHALFAYYGEEPSCVDYLMVTGNVFLPDCYRLAWNNPKYWLYSSK